MLYRELPPRPELGCHINCFWMIRAPRPGTLRDRTFPDGCQELVFNLDTRVLRDDGRGFTRNPPAELVGQMTRPYDLRTSGRQLFFGVKFFPHSFSLFTRESVHDLRDQSIDLCTLLGSGFARTCDSVFERADFAHFVSAMESYFLHALGKADTAHKSYRAVDSAVRALFSPAPPSLRALCVQLGVSERYLQLAFRHRTGLAPKQLLKMIRFQKSFQYLRDRRLSLTEVAQLAGYYDHAHFTHDFRTLAGLSPSHYLRMETPLNQFFLAQDSRAYLCSMR